jgi:hypothetical protein
MDTPGIPPSQSVMSNPPTVSTSMLPLADLLRLWPTLPAEQQQAIRTLLATPPLPTSPPLPPPLPPAPPPMVPGGRRRERQARPRFT